MPTPRSRRPCWRKCFTSSFTRSLSTVLRHSHARFGFSRVLPADLGLCLRQVSKLVAFGPHPASHVPGSLPLRVSSNPALIQLRFLPGRKLAWPARVKRGHREKATSPPCPAHGSLDPGQRRRAHAVILSSQAQIVFDAFPHADGASPCCDYDCRGRPGCRALEHIKIL